MITAVTERREQVGEASGTWEDAWDEIRVFWVPRARWMKEKNPAVVSVTFRPEPNVRDGTAGGNWKIIAFIEEREQDS